MDVHTNTDANVREWPWWAWFMLGSMLDRAGVFHLVMWCALFAWAVGWVLRWYRSHAQPREEVSSYGVDDDPNRPRGDK